MGRKKNWHWEEINERRERLLFAIEVWGYSAVYQHETDLSQLVRYKDELGILMVKQALRAAGMQSSDLEDLFVGSHGDWCACWRCVGRLHLTVMKEWASRSVDDERREDEDEANLPSLQGEGNFDGVRRQRPCSLSEERNVLSLPG